MRSHSLQFMLSHVAHCTLHTTRCSDNVSHDKRWGRCNGRHVPHVRLNSNNCDTGGGGGAVVGGAMTTQQLVHAALGWSTAAAGWELYKRCEKKSHQRCSFSMRSLFICYCFCCYYYYCMCLRKLRPALWLNRNYENDTFNTLLLLPLTLAFRFGCCLCFL